MGRSRTFIFDNFPYTVMENRVRPKRYDDQFIVSTEDPRLVQMPNGTWLHWAAAAKWKPLAAAAKAAGYKLRIGSGWREKKYKTRAEFEARAIARYKTLDNARGKIAYVGAHQLGLAVDLGKPFAATFGPGNSVRDKHYLLPEFRWLIINAAQYGWTPYMGRDRGVDGFGEYETWHWECFVGKDIWLSLPDEELLARRSLEARRAGQYAGAGRRTIWTAAGELADRLRGVEAAREPPVEGVFVKDTFQTAGLLYDFQTGRWIDRE